MFWVWLIVFPLSCGIIGWITNVLAVKMIFRPSAPLALGAVRFQGVLPKHLEHFASQLAAIVVSEFVTVTSMVKAVDASQVLASVQPEVERVVERLVNAVREAIQGPAAALLTDANVAQLRANFERQLVEEIPAAVDAVAERAEEVVDLQDMVARTFFEMGPRRIEAIIYEVSRRELTFIELYGGLFGAMLGFGQFVLLQLVPSQYLVPIVGLVVGAVTNYMAIQMLFHPKEPKRLFTGHEWQGLFPKRQREIASTMGRVAARDVIRPLDVFQQLADRILPPELDHDTLRLLEQGAAQRWPMLSMMAAGLSAEQKNALYTRLSSLYAEERGSLVGSVARASADQLDIKEMVASRVARLSTTAFADIIRGLFEQEELYLIIYGALLGGLIGFVQVYVTSGL